MNLGTFPLPPCFDVCSVSHHMEPHKFFWIWEMVELRCIPSYQLTYISYLFPDTKEPEIILCSYWSAFGCSAAVEMLPSFHRIFRSVTLLQMRSYWRNNFSHRVLLKSVVAHSCGKDWSGTLSQAAHVWVAASKLMDAIQVNSVKNCWLQPGPLRTQPQSSTCEPLGFTLVSADPSQGICNFCQNVTNKMQKFSIHCCSASNRKQSHRNPGQKGKGAMGLQNLESYGAAFPVFMLLQCTDTFLSSALRGNSQDLTHSHSSDPSRGIRYG